MGYIPNLSAQKGVADKRLTRDKMQDEHTCLAAIFKGKIVQIHHEMKSVIRGSPGIFCHFKYRTF